MADYQKAKIYGIFSPDRKLHYVGSTTRSLNTRFSLHKAHYQMWKDGLTNYISVFDIFERYNIEDCKIELLQSFPCATKYELRKREGEFIMMTKNVNKRVAGRTSDEFKRTVGREKHICTYCSNSYDLNHRTRHLASKKHLKT
jgi:hypothetical protein